MCFVTRETIALVVAFHCNENKGYNTRAFPCISILQLNNLCFDEKTSQMCFIELHDISNVFLVMHMHAIT